MLKRNEKKLNINMKKHIIFILMVSSLFNFSQAQDWPNLDRFRKANVELGAPKSGEQRVVFMGNSITEGWLQIHPEFFSGKPYINRGIGGQTTPQMLLRFRQDVINLNPAVVVILAGINDIAGNTGPSTVEMIEHNIISMIELAKTNNIKVVLCSVLPAAEFVWRPEKKPALMVIELNEKLQVYAKESKVVYVDYFSAMVNDRNGLKREFGEDGVHPNKTGYLIMEPILEKGIAEALKHY